MPYDAKALADAALAARAKAYCPYSGFAVGAALAGENGEIYTGCNIENASYGVTNCAERTALFTAVGRGARRFAALAVAGAPAGQAPPLPPCPPCGVCRQALLEFCPPEMPVLLVQAPGQYETHTLGELLPLGFGPGALL